MPKMKKPPRRMARVVGCAFLVAVGVGAFVDRGVPARGRGPAPLGASAVAPLPRVVVDLDVVADTLPLESEVYLETLQHLRPDYWFAAHLHTNAV